VIPAFHRAAFLPPPQGDIKAKRPSAAAITRFLSLVAIAASAHPKVADRHTQTEPQNKQRPPSHSRI